LISAACATRCLASRVCSLSEDQVGTLYTKGCDQTENALPTSYVPLRDHHKQHSLERFEPGGLLSVTLPRFQRRKHLPYSLQTEPRSSYRVPLQTRLRIQKSEMDAEAGPLMYRSRYHIRTLCVIR